MQVREAKHVKLAKYVENTCNAKRSLRWWTVFRYVHGVTTRKRPFSIDYRCEKKNISESYIPKIVRDRLQIVRPPCWLERKCVLRKH